MGKIRRCNHVIFITFRWNFYDEMIDRRNVKSIPQPGCNVILTVAVIFLNPPLLISTVAFSSLTKFECFMPRIYGTVEPPIMRSLKKTQYYFWKIGGGQEENYISNQWCPPWSILRNTTQFLNKCWPYWELMSFYKNVLVHGCHRRS